MSKTTIAASAVMLAAAMAAGCAGNDQLPSPGFTQAQASIDQAEQANAQRYASQELNMAREKLDQAREAQEDGDDELAGRLAMRAQLDAELAAATASNQEMQMAAAELRETIETLRSEVSRGAAPAP
ncbi:MAG TPA: DUF4398 domain-containing protein [Gammaproteobacteria bacterium]